MSDMVGKVSVQEKIAELESRIVKLESAMRPGGIYEYSTVTRKVGSDPPLGEHWQKMWDEFHLMMKDVFK